MLLSYDEPEGAFLGKTRQQGIAVLKMTGNKSMHMSLCEPRRELGFDKVIKVSSDSK